MLACNFIAYMSLLIIPNTLSNIWLNGIATVVVVMVDYLISADVKILNIANLIQ